MAESTKLDEVIATRHLTFRRIGNDDEAVTISVHAPFESEHGDWQCFYRIQAISFAKTFRMSGVDSMQALIHTVLIISVELEVLARKHEGLFLHFENADTGFPPFDLLQSK